MNVARIRRENGASMGRKWRPPATGFTLIELLVVVSILGVLAAVAGPSLARLIDSNRLTFIANDFLSAMYLTRSEALKHRGRAVMCKSSTGVSCAHSGGWDQGWIVFRDTNNNSSLDAGEPVVHHTQALPRGFRLTGNQSLADYISFAPSGRTRLVSGAFQAGTLTLCKQSAPGLEARQIVINNAGRARVNREPAHACM